MPRFRLIAAPFFAAALGALVALPSVATASRMEGATGSATYDHVAKTVTLQGTMLDRAEADDGDGESHLRFPDI